MEVLPPTREEVERLPLPELLHRAQQLGADISFAHDRNEIIEALAGQRRQILARYSEELQKFKLKLEGQSQEIELTKQHYQGTYDRVEQAVTDRFAQLHDQLLRKEVEVRGHLAYLKNSGDEVITDCSSAMDKELSILQDTLVRCQSKNLDVLDIQPASTAITVTVPALSGKCFDFADIPALDLGSLKVTLDLNASSRMMQMEPPNLRGLYQKPELSHPASQNYNVHPPRSYGYDAYGAAGNSYPGQHSVHQHPSNSRLNDNFSPVPGYGAPSLSQQASNDPGIDVLTFPPDPEIEMKQDNAGLTLRLVPNAASEVVGRKANEVFSEGLHVWKVRLDNIQESLLGMVDSRDLSSAGAGDGFFWSPLRRDVHGKRGRASPTLSSIPVAQQGDVLKMTYDAGAGTLRATQNGVDRGLLCTDLRGMLSPCFIFARGEGLTLLQ
ncbi:zinc finger protein [Diplonema papillatum]|nr:zinc finger protein [Diplonema papillatum]